MKKRITYVMVSLMCGCGGAEFAGNDVGTSMGADAAIEASEVDTQTTGQNDANPNGSPDGRVDVPTDAGADMQAEGEASAPFEASTDGGVVSDGGPSDGQTGSIPTCGENEVYPQLSPTCRNYIVTTSFPLYVGCCRMNHVCGMVIGNGCQPFPGSE